ncbi:collagen alpha-1(XII) chain-like [Styela clava]
MTFKKILLTLCIVSIWALSTEGLKCWTCENQASPRDCLQSGSLKQCRYLEKSCQTVVRVFEGTKTYISTGCKEVDACGRNEEQNPRRAWTPTQCNGNTMNSVCRCCCGTDRCNRNNLLCKPRRGDAPAPTKDATPTPLEPLCDDVPTLSYGMVECDAGRKIGSQCRFFCSGDHEMRGPSTVTCERKGKVAKWNEESPICIAPEPSCKDLGNLPHGEFVCTREDNKVGTICGFRCIDDGYDLLSTTDAIECVTDAAGKAKWSHRKPCCTSQCPPMAKKDVVIVMDSSNSISNREWKIMKSFVANITGKFEVSEDGVQFAFYRFNRKVDEESQILFGDYTNDVDGLKQAVIDMPKRGGGTFIGRALKHAKNHVLTTNNRKDVEDLVWVLTDGRSDDKLDVVSKELRDSGVEIMALGISRQDKPVDIKQLINMAGHSDNVLEVKNGMKSLTDNLSHRIVKKICQFSCPAE